jgi:hypothetical protein
MLRKLALFLLTVLFLVGSTGISSSAQTLSPNALKVKAKAEERARGQSRTKVKVLSDATYIGIVGDIRDTTFTVTDKNGGKHEVQYANVKSIGGTGWSTGAKLGLGIAIGAGAVLGVLAAIVASND